MSSKKSNNSLNNSKRTKKEFVKKLKTKKFAEKTAKQIFRDSLKKFNCIGEKKKFDEVKKLFQEQKEKVKQCDKENYKYGDENFSLVKLIEIIKKENKENVIDLIELFPYIGYKGIKVSQQHVFEALWFIIFLMSYDDLRKDNFKRIFKTKQIGRASCRERV